MAKYRFFAGIIHHNNVIEIPDEKLEGLSEEEKNDVILEYHDKWAKRNIYGEWEEVK